MVVVNGWSQVTNGRRQPVEVLAIGTAGAARRRYQPGDVLVALLAAEEHIRLHGQVKLQFESQQLIDSMKFNNNRQSISHTGLIELPMYQVLN